MAGDHDAEAGLWETVLGWAGVDDLVHHDHRATTELLGLAGLD